MPERRTGVVVLVNPNTAPTWALPMAVGPVSAAPMASGPDAATETFRSLPTA